MVKADVLLAAGDQREREREGVLVGGGVSGQNYCLSRDCKVKNKGNVLNPSLKNTSKD